MDEPVELSADLFKQVSSKGSVRFSERLNEVLKPAASVRDTLEKMVKAALEVEFGSSLSFSPGFDKMTESIAESILNEPQLRRQALLIASFYLDKKIINQQNKPDEPKSK